MVQQPFVHGQASLAGFWRKASPAELAFYQAQLYPLQNRVFDVARLYRDALYLTGGTALARFFFEHRLSEDLDFFTIGDDLRYIATDLIARLEGRSLIVNVERLEVYFARFYVAQADVQLKIEFAREYHLVDDLIETAHGVYVNSLADIGANKISAFEDRAEIKDIIDLYYITRRLPLTHLFELADIKRVPVAYENLLAINAQGLTGRALVTAELDEADLGRFLDLLKRDVELEVKKKERLTAGRLPQLTDKLLWDFPRDERGLTAATAPVLRRRARQLPLPDRRALLKALPAIER
ncbi:MAG: nucleotidyl transferase AbiEii/AbiGii toxin family protein [Chloroflexi bacterium]|nr:nucleotidyl transferase AbiEii/AbiGii toxin family protein [Chloroflexota bacterium]